LTFDCSSVSRASRKKVPAALGICSYIYLYRREGRLSSLRQKKRNTGNVVTETLKLNTYS